jgi:hypothetical protein
LAPVEGRVSNYLLANTGRDLIGNLPAIKVNLCYILSYGNFENFSVRRLSVLTYVEHTCEVTVHQNFRNQYNYAVFKPVSDEA